MKIGLIASAYNCANFLDNCLKGWKEFKGKSDTELVCSFIHNCFEDNEDMGLPISSPDNTHELLENEYNNDFLDYYNFSNKYLSEAGARSICLRNVLDDDVDYVWTIGIDEFYSSEEIDRILSFVKMNPLVDWFKVNYKNYVFDGKSWIDGFCPPRIFKVNTHGGLKELYYDDDFVYEDGTDYKAMSSLEIPRNIAHVKHMTWLHENGKSKVEYQKKRWGENGCSYSWDYKQNKLTFNDSFYKKTNTPLPTLIKD